VVGVTRVLARPNPVADQVSEMLGALAPGLYRSTMTVCRVDVGPEGLERGSTVVLTHCVDFTVAPPALPPVTDETKEGEP